MIYKNWKNSLNIKIVFAFFIILEGSLFSRVDKRIQIKSEAKVRSISNKKLIESSYSNKLDKTSPSNQLNTLDIKRRTKIIDSSGLWSINQGGTFEGLNSDPQHSMIKIVSSHVQLDFNGHTVLKGRSQSTGYIAVEVGYSPAELAANPSLNQVKDVFITSGRFENFDCVIFVHSGVEQVAIQDCYIDGCSTGIVFFRANSKLYR